MLAVAHIPFTGFEVPPEVVVLGLVTGLTYALLGVGIVLIYKTSRVLNFAHGEMGALASVVIPVLVVNHHWNYWAAAGAALVVAAATGAFMEFVPIRRLARAPRLIVLVATIGASQLFFAINSFIPKEGRLGSAVFPTPFRASFTIGSLRLGTGELLILITVPIITIALVLFFRLTKLGLASRAAADNADAARLTGIPVGRVSLTVWVMAGVLAAVSAILIGPTHPIVTRVALGPGLMVRALAAAMIGGMSSMPRAFAGGVAIGIIELLVSWNYPTGGTLEVVLFAVILGSLLIQRRLGQLARGGEASSWSLAGTLRALEGRVKRLPRVRALGAGGLAALLLAAVLLPVPMSHSQRVLMSSIVIFAMMGLSLTVLTGYAGQVSLGQFAFVGVGALVGGRMHQLGYPPWMGVLYAVVAGGLVALIIGLPALRIRGLFLAVTTLGFAVATQTWLYGQHWLVQVVGGRTSLEIPRPTWLGINFQSEINYYYLSLGVLVALATLVHRLRTTGIGRSMMAVRDNEPAAATLGVSPRRVKLTAFVVAGMIAALAGYFYGGLLVSFTDANTFSPELSLALVGQVILGGVTTVTGAIIGAIWLKGLAYVLGPLLPELVGADVTIIVGGFGLLGAILQFPGGIAEVAFKVRDKAVQWVTGTPLEREAPEEDTVRTRTRLEPMAADLVSTSANGDASRPAIEAHGIVVRFGGNLALNRVSIHADPGEIVGIVGPNGAGKTTLFDVLSGHLRPDAGQVVLEGRDVTRMRPEQRARVGMGRTFQQARLFDEMVLVDAFKVALERDETSEVVPSILGLPPARRAERRKDTDAAELLELMGLSAFSHLHVSELSTGMRRLAELGTMVGLGARVLLLDEPTAGIAQREVEAFRPVLREIRDHLDATLVVIEHDIPLMMGLVDRMYVLNAGEVIAEGPPRLLREDAKVIAAYLGTDERVIQRSGTLARAIETSEVGDGRRRKR